MAETIRTPNGILSFPAVFVARKPHPTAQEARFSINILFDEAAQKTPEYKDMRREVKNAAEEKFGSNVEFSKLRLPFREAGEKDYNGYEEGMIFIQAWSKTKPGVVDARLQEIHDASDVWPGQLCRATIKPFAYDNSGNRGVSFALNNIQIVNTDMPRLDGRKKATEDFDALDSDEDMESPGDDDIPF